MDFLFLTSGGANSKSLRWILQAGKFSRFGEKSDRVFHYYLVTRMTDWAQTLTDVLFHVCVGSHKVRTLIFAIYQCCGMALTISMCLWVCWRCWSFSLCEWWRGISRTASWPNFFKWMGMSIGRRAFVIMRLVAKIKTDFIKLPCDINMPLGFNASVQSL